MTMRKLVFLIVNAAATTCLLVGAFAMPAHAGWPPNQSETPYHSQAREVPTPTLPEAPSPDTSGEPSQSFSAENSRPATSEPASPPLSIQPEEPRPADEQPDNAPPFVSEITSQPLNVQPAAGGSSTQLVAVEVHDPDTIADLNSLTLCLYSTTAGDSTCDVTETTSTMKLEWSRAANMFTMLPTGPATTWSEQGSAVTTYPDVASTISVTFRFKVSTVARQGQWKVWVRAIDNSGAASEMSDQDATVKYYASISPRPSQAFSDFGPGRSLLTGGTAYALAVSDGQITTNGPSTVSISLDGPFVSHRPPVVATMMGGSAETAVVKGTIALDCSPGSSFEESSAVRLTTNPQILDYIAPTGESGLSVAVHSCRLTSGGHIRAGTYQATVTTAIGPREAGVTAGLEQDGKSL